ncbi:MAG: tetratricopeptide repeat protein [Candidatus Omnitrophota bacterium]
MKVKTSASLLCLFFLLPLSSVLRAEIIQLKNGNAMETKILKEDDEFVTIQAPGGKVKIPKRDIQILWRGSTADLLTVQGGQVFFAKGMELYQEGQFQDAVEAFEKALTPRAANAIIYANIGSAYASAGETQKAEGSFLRALEAKPGDPDILLNLAHLYEASKDYKTAIPYYQKIAALKSDHFVVDRNLAYCLYMSGDYLGAAKIFEGMGEKNDVVAVCNAAAAYIQAGEPDRAAAILTPLIENPSPVPRTYLLMAEISRLRKDYSEAEDYYKKALKNDPDLEKVKTGLGGLYLDMKDWAKAEAAFKEVLAKDPGSLGASRGLAQVFIQKGEFPEAISQYEKLTKKNPDDPAIANGLGLVYLKMNNPKVALEIFRKILARNNGDAKAHSNAGLAYVLMRDADNALKEWNRAIELDPKLEPALRNKKLLEDAIQGSRNEKAAPR